MSSTLRLRHFVNERLTAAADEILQVFEKAITVYEEEILRQRKLLDMVYKPNVRIQRTVIPQEPEIMARFDGQQCRQDIESSFCHIDLEPSPIKEEQVEEQEYFTSSKGEKLVLKEEPETLNIAFEQQYHTENKVVSLKTGCIRTIDSTAGEKETSVVNESLLLESDKESMTISDPNSDTEQHGYVEALQESHVCPICRKSYLMDKQLKLHMKIHTGKTIYRCSYCGKVFTFNSSLTRHLRVHTGEKPYECRLCGKRFNVSTTLKVHYRSHTGEKPYKCKVCDKAFTTCSNLKKHSALHKNTK